MIILHPSDTCGTLLGDAGSGDRLIPAGGGEPLQARGRIAYGHKVALRDAPAGSPVVKHGFPIGRLSASVRAGEHLHVHNIASGYDERSAHLDVETGAPGDIPYA